MKVIKKSKILPVNCEVCHSVFQPKYRNLERDNYTATKTMVRCPVCNKFNQVKFKEL